MDGESEPNPVVADEAEEREEPIEATPSPQQQATSIEEDSQELVSMTTEESSTKEDKTKENDDDVVLVEEEEEEAAQPSATTGSQDTLSIDCLEPDTDVQPFTTAMPSSPTSSSVAAAPLKSSVTAAEPIVIDDEEELEQKDTPSTSPAPPAGSSASHSPGVLSSTEPDSEIRISSVTTLGSRRQDGSTVSAASTPPNSVDAQEDLNLMITSVTSLQGGDASVTEAVEVLAEENGVLIGSAFSLTSDTSSGCPTASFNPGRGSDSLDQQVVQNGDTGTHDGADTWISQSASVPRSLKQSGVDSPSLATSLPKPPGQSSSSSSGSQTQPRTVKVTCANCKKPLKKGQTAYQRKGSTHLFCSTTCLSAFSHKPTPKKSCTMCKKDITNMKGTIVAQVDSSESFQEFCSTGCLGAYENKQNPSKSGLKTKCTVCGKLTEIRHEVSFKTVTHKICSDACFNVYRRANGLIMNCCEQCGDYLSSRPSANYFVLVDGQQKRFCCHNCSKEFKQANSKLASCLTCNTLIKTGEVLHSIDTGGTMGSYCSVNCMNKSKLPSTTFPNAEPVCHYCKRNSLPQYQATLPEGDVLNFCSSQCVTKFQNAPLQTATNGQTPLSTKNSIQLKCNYCRGSFSLKPEILDWKDKIYQFCSKACCEDYKKLHCIVTFCCKLLFKQDFIRRLGLKCVSCNHCTQLCKKGLTREFGNVTRDFCSEACAKKFQDWFFKAARCDCCKVQGKLTESVMWREEMKQFCDQECLLRFYCQQNEPIMVTQKGPENSSLGYDVHGAKLGMMTQSTAPYTGGGFLRDVKNKAVLCKPLTLTKATYCKPHMQSKLLQTDVDDGIKREFVPVPIPVPVFIPVPMNMYSQVTPTPLSLPVPVPVPVFVPTTLEGAEQIIQTISELKSDMSSKPHNENMLPIPISDTSDQKSDVKVHVKKEQKEEESSSSSCSSSDLEEEGEEDKYDPDLDLETDFPHTSDPVPAVEGMDEDMSLSLPLVLAEEKESEEPAPQPQPRRRGNKRQAVEENADLASSISNKTPSEGRSLPLKARYGINAWRRWALSVYGQSKDVKRKDSATPALPKSNLVSMSSEELNAALSCFVKEVCRPSGERYSPDSILYLCLGIQQHLHAKGRKDDLFSDPCYQQFGEELNKVLKDWQPSVLPDGSLWGRVQEQSLWSSRQLDDQSPSALLRSLVYLNTKYFGLRTVEQHLRLSFANVYGPDTIHPVTKETTVCIRVPSISQDEHVQTESKKRKRSLQEGDPDDFTECCSVKKHECHLYELYRSKCPLLLRQRLDIFYVQPDPSCGVNDPLWFSSAPLQRHVLESLLSRALMVRDVYTDGQSLQEEREKAASGE
ncbi:zinc finger MYM-type protein 2 isoform X2 [Gouania willdenowi]|uniref:zinc finger MYM-type protein 2 isoform X2 n=1 Tax=Gouania willdenowi TaxID=441366 RepID=UPI0010543909|nr:zinc finger MYM-type protein 2 isoform X2 [Gouania willdenowi]